MKKKNFVIVLGLLLLLSACGKTSDGSSKSSTDNGSSIERPTDGVVDTPIVDF